MRIQAERLIESALLSFMQKHGDNLPTSEEEVHLELALCPRWQEASSEVRQIAQTIVRNAFELEIFVLNILDDYEEVPRDVNAKSKPGYKVGPGPNCASHTHGHSHR